MTPHNEFRATATRLAPRAAIILGSGLAGAITTYTPTAAVSFGDVPGLAPASVHGHSGKVSVGLWAGVPVLVFHGRLHYYEGHSWDTVTGTVRLAAELGAKVLVLTNAAGGIHERLFPGELMLLKQHLSLLDAKAWPVDLAANPSPYSAELSQVILKHEAEAGRALHCGVYAALTGPCYETPAEIRALQAMGADAVGMSTAKEAEAGVTAGMHVVALSCITNKAAGLSAGALDHVEVLANAKAPAVRVGEIIGVVVRAFPSTITVI